MKIKLHFIVKFISWNRIFKAVEKEVNFVFNFIRSAGRAKPVLDYSQSAFGRNYQIQSLTPMIASA